MNFPELLAKSWNGGNADVATPEYAKLVPHLRAVTEAGLAIVEYAGDEILQQLSLVPSLWMPRLREVMRVACLLHDVGKANERFQEMVRGKLDPRRQPARHELLSALLLADRESPVRAWALEELNFESENDDAERLLNCVIGAVAGHHLKVDQDWEKAAQALKGGCGTEFRMILTHPDLQQLFRKALANEDPCFSLIEGIPGCLGSRRMPFNVASSRWRDFTKKGPAWGRFAAAAKALLMAADVAGSAMLPEGEDIRDWVRRTLSQRVTKAGMLEVVSARLDGKTARPFLNCNCGIDGAGDANGGGMWKRKDSGGVSLGVAQRAQGRKLFFLLSNDRNRHGGLSRLRSRNRCGSETGSTSSCGRRPLMVIASVVDDERDLITC